MNRLVVNPGTESAWEIPLRAGTVSLGRDAGNDFMIDHPSVAGTHCQLLVMDSGVVIKSLDTTGGVLVDGRPVEETLLLPGQTVRLGEIELRLVADTPTPQSLTPAPRTSAASAEEKSFFARIPEAFSYPLQGNGPVLLICGAVFFGVVGFAQRVIGFLGPYGFVVGLGLGVYAVGFLFSYAKSIITTTANNDAHPPDWPDCTEWQQDIVEPFCQLVALVALNFGAAIILGWWRPGGETFAHAARITAFALGALFLPMGMMALALLDSIAALNPIALVVSIFRIPLAYLAAAAIFEALLAAFWFADGIVGQFIPLPILPGLISGFMNLYLTVAAMRILGLLYLTKKDELGWFN
jgi:hypothetical protein